MASDIDLLNPANNELLDKMHEELPELYPENLALHMVAALLWLDEAKSFHQEGNYVLLNPELGHTMLFEQFAYPARRMAKVWESGRFSEFDELARTPFEFMFDDHERIPPNLRRKQVLVAIMSKEEAGCSPLFAYMAVTLHRDGTFVGDSNIYGYRRIV